MNRKLAISIFLAVLLGLLMAGGYQALAAGGDGAVNLTNNTFNDSGAVVSPDGSKIAFVSNRDGNHEIYMMNADGSYPVRLTSDPAGQERGDVDPAWSPDGSKIAFVRDEWDGNNWDYEIYVMNAEDGSGRIRLTNNTMHDMYPAWSPDGTEIAFEGREGDGNSEIYVMGASGAGVPLRLTNNTLDNIYPEWSPDGTRIAFTSFGGGHPDIYSVNASGSAAPERLTNSARDAYPAWSPDGSQIAFQSGRDGDDEVYVMNADGSSQTRLTNNPGGDMVLPFNQPWSPDGTRLLFLGNRNGDGNVFVMNADGSDQTRLTNNGNSYAPSWFSDGTRIAFQNNRDGDYDIYVREVMAPTVTSVTPSDAINTSDTTISAAYSDTGGSGIDTASVVVNLNGSQLTGCNPTLTGVSCPVSNLNDGNYTISGSVADNAGNSSPISGSFTVDTTTPQITNIKPSGATSSASTTISADYTDNGSGIDTTSVTVKLDGKTVDMSKCTLAATKVSCPVSGYAKGRHKITVSANDQAGNRASQDQGFTYEDVPPVISNLMPAATNKASVTISATFTDGPQGYASGVNTKSVTAKLDNKPVKCTVTATRVSCPVSGLAKGKHTVSVSVRDNAGKLASKSYWFVYEATAPVISNLKPGGTNKAWTTLSATISDGPQGYASGVNPATAVVKLDGVVRSCTKTATGVNCPVSGLAKGQHTMLVSVRDKAGNLATRNQSFVYETTVPVISNFKPTGTLSTSSTTISATLTDPVGPERLASGVNSASVLVKLDGQAKNCRVTRTSATQISVSCPVSNLVTDNHTASVFVRDLAGNVRTKSWSFKRQPPPPPPPASDERCDPNYDRCIPPYPPDLDCADIGFSVRVIGPSDPHRLDGDGDGIGCESYR